MLVKLTPGLGRKVAWFEVYYDQFYLTPSGKKDVNCSFVNCFFLLTCPMRLPIFSLFSNEPELGTEIDPGMVVTPFPSSILGRDSNPQPYDH
jgi:hypothetical protein